MKEMNSGANREPVRIEIEAQDTYRIMWLAGVREVDLTQHCLKAFAECDRHDVTHRRRTQTLLLPTDNPPAAWYLCALPIPWDWGRNAHLAFEHAPGETWQGDATVPGLKVKLTNARPITGWGEQSIPLDAPLRSGRRYRTCRNWQFAWWLKMHRRIPDAAPRPAAAPPESRGEQLTF
ncbi:hypothetical protein ACFYVL_14225 [Streptomyces sp. NPDC004111]|uniref:hypothetical protein n=1 Tax=Streptomyces sp. NPDC004111 TaxID=3364690 RepID=UPI0036C39D6C